MRLLGTFPMLALALVIFSIVSLCLAQQSILLLVVAGVLAAMSWYVTEGPRGRALPRWTTNILIVAVCVGVLVDLAQHRQDILGVLGRFLVWLTLIKLYQRKAPRDYAQLLSLSLLLMLLGCSQSDDLLLGAALLVYAVFGLYVLLLFQLYASYEKTRTARLGAIPAGYRLGPSLAPVFGRRPELHFRTLTAGIAGVGLLTSAILFMIFPRDVGRGLISPAPGSSIRRAGFTDEVNLATSTRITDSRKVVMSVRLAETPPHAQRPLRLRGAVLDRYEDGRWTATRSDRARLIESGPPGFVRLGATAGDTGPPITPPTTQEFDLPPPSPPGARARG